MSTIPLYTYYLLIMTILNDQKFTNSGINWINLRSYYQYIGFNLCTVLSTRVLWLRKLLKQPINNYID